MHPRLNRRDFLKLLSLAALSPVAPFGESASQAPERPNILILVLDTLSARHLSLYGYPRQTMPNLERFAAGCTVYHRHFAAGNFTTSGAASLLTGVYPWTHRAFNTRGTVIPEFASKNIFSVLDGSPYFRTAYSHNDYAVLFFNQFQKSIDYLKPTEDLFLADEVLLDGIFPKDQNAALLSEDILLPRDERLPASLFLSIADQWRRYYLLNQVEKQRSAQFPYGFPMVDENFHPFLLEDATDWLVSQLGSMRQPFLMYHHVLPPHEPYRPRLEFTDLFNDGWKPPSKPEHFFTKNVPQAGLDQRRLMYDRYIAYADAELGRIIQKLEASGLLESTHVVITSDHGQMFERGVHGHITPTLYHPLLHIPLVISSPGQTRREDVHSLTSAVDILPTLCHLAGIAAPERSEGELLPPFNPAPTPNRSVFALEAKTSFKYKPLIAGSVAIMKGSYKLVRFFGFRDYHEIYEMYDLDQDPEELNDIYPLQVQGVKQMRSEITTQLREADQAYSQ